MHYRPVVYMCPRAGMLSVCALDNMDEVTCSDCMDIAARQVEQRMGADHVRCSACDGKGVFDAGEHGYPHLHGCEVCGGSGVVGTT